MGHVRTSKWRGARSTEGLRRGTPNTYVAQLGPSSASLAEHRYSFIYNTVIIYRLIVTGAQKSLRNLKIVVSYTCMCSVCVFVCRYDYTC